MGCQWLHGEIWRLFAANVPHAETARALLALVWDGARRAADLWGAHGWATTMDQLVDLFNWDDRCA
jgi:hypothetical protein